ncbi:MAG: hypothetical protein WBD30_11905 [Bacteroidota bacterium]
MALITCPKCNHKFDVETALSQQLEERYKEEADKRVIALEAKYGKKEETLKQREHEESVLW